MRFTKKDFIRSFEEEEEEEGVLEEEFYVADLDSFLCLIGKKNRRKNADDWEEYYDGMKGNFWQ